MVRIIIKKRNTARSAKLNVATGIYKQGTQQVVRGSSYKTHSVETAYKMQQELTLVMWQAIVTSQNCVIRRELTVDGDNVRDG